MAAPEGNQFWKLRNKHGRDKLFQSPDLLLQSAHEYFTWCDENPIKTIETTTSDKGVFIKEKTLQIPYSKEGWYASIGCSDNWLREFKKTASQDFLRVIEEIEIYIDNNQFTGASVGIFNPNIIARKLGLQEHTKHSGDSNEPVTFASIKFKE